MDPIEPPKTKPVDLLKNFNEQTLKADFMTLLKLDDEKAGKFSKNFIKKVNDWFNNNFDGDDDHYTIIETTNKIFYQEFFIVIEYNSVLKQISGYEIVMNKDELIAEKEKVIIMFSKREGKNTVDLTIDYNPNEDE